MDGGAAACPRMIRTLVRPASINPPEGNANPRLVWSGAANSLGAADVVVTPSASARPSSANGPTVLPTTVAEATAGSGQGLPCRHREWAMAEAEAGPWARAAEAVTAAVEAAAHAEAAEAERPAAAAAEAAVAVNTVSSFRSCLLFLPKRPPI